MKTRITKTLLDSWGYMFDCAEGYEQEAREEFITTLKREQTPPNEAQQAGLEFEHLVQEIAEDRFRPEWVGSGTVSSVTGECEEDRGNRPRWTVAGTRFHRCHGGWPDVLVARIL